MYCESLLGMPDRVSCHKELQLPPPGEHQPCPGEVGNIESEWTMFCASNVESASRCCGQKVIYVKAKTRAWGEFSEAMESCFRKALDHRSVSEEGKQCTVNTAYSGDGVLTSTQDIVNLWKEYFEDLLHPTNTPSMEEAGPVDLGMSAHVSGAEVAEVVKNLLDDGPRLLSLSAKVYSRVLKTRFR